MGERLGLGVRPYGTPDDGLLPVWAPVDEEGGEGHLEIVAKF